MPLTVTGTVHLGTRTLGNIPMGSYFLGKVECQLLKDEVYLFSVVPGKYHNEVLLLYWILGHTLHCGTRWISLPPDKQVTDYCPITDVKIQYTYDS